MSDLQNSGHSEGGLLSTVIGFASSLLYYILRTDISSWAIDTTLKVFEAIIVASAGAITGFVVQRQLNKFFKKQKIDKP